MPASPKFSRLRILCVDPSSNMRRIYRALLLGMGVGDVVTADDGAAAYEMFRSSRPDIVITEINLPLISGLDLAKMVRTRPDSPSRYAPIIVCAAETTRQAILTARDWGVTEFLAKPISPKMLQERLEAALANPRVFVESSSYVGPDRRRSAADGPYRGPDRRGRRKDDRRAPRQETAP